MTIRNILIAGDALLRKETLPVENIDNRVLEVIDDMQDTAVAHKALGLAASQIGEDLSIILVFKEILGIRREPEDLHIFEVLINPRYDQVKGCKVAKHSESCLSVPGVSGKVKRPQHIVATWQTIEGDEKVIELTGFNAHVFQHEVDHLLGKLWIQHESVGNFVRQRATRKMKALQSKMKKNGLTYNDLFLGR